MTASASEHVWVVIAAYNEATVIAGVVADLERAGYRGGRGRRRLGATAPARSRRHGRRRRGDTSDQSRPGRRAADRHRVRAASRAPTSSSPSTPTASIAPPISPRLIERPRARNDADFALGSRFLGTSVNLPLSRRLVLTAATWFTRAHHRAARHRHPQRPARHDARAAPAASGCARTAWRTPPRSCTRSPRADSTTSRSPVTIEYSAYSLAKGQTLGDALLDPDRPVRPEAAPMIAQLVLTALLARHPALCLDRPIRTRAGDRAARRRWRRWPASISSGCRRTPRGSPSSSASAAASTSSSTSGW